MNIIPFYDQLKELPIFVGFDNNKNPYGVDDVKGVSKEDSLSRRGTYDDIKKLNKQFIGIGLAAPVQIGDKYLVCFDFDWKRSIDLKPHPKQWELIQKLTSEGHAYEKSHSGNGCHFWVLMDKENIPLGAKLGKGYEIEVFSGIGKGNSNVLVTDRELNGTLKELSEIDLPKQSFNVKDSNNDPSLMSKSQIMDVFHASKYNNEEHDEWIAIGMVCHKEFEGDDAGLDLWLDWSKPASNFSESECRKRWESFHLKEGGIGLGSIIYAALANGYKFPIKETAAEAVARDPYRRNDNGVILPLQFNLFFVLKHFQIRFDRFKDREIGVFDGIARPITDTDITKIQYHCEQLGFSKIPTAMVKENVSFFASQNSYDSAIEWASKLQWDGVKRCENILANYFGAKDSEYSRAISAYMCTGMAGRLLVPGIKVDSAVVLYGAQGTGKTSSVQALAPDDCFGELNFKSKDDDKSRMILGKLIMELSELRGLRSSAAGDIKSFLSRQWEEWVEKYKSYPHKYARRCFFIGTTNEKEFLSDSTGNRRWWPIEVGPSNHVQLLSDRDQIWAEAIEWFKRDGIQLVDQDTYSSIHEEFTSYPPIVDDLNQYFHDHPEITKFHSAELYQEITHYVPDTRQLSTFKHAMDYLKDWKKAPGAFWIGKKKAQGYKKIGTHLDE